MASDLSIMRQIQKDVVTADKPYGFGKVQCDLAIHKKWLDEWLKNPQHDCLRARGDIRWNLACRLQMAVDSFLNPF